MPFRVKDLLITVVPEEIEAQAHHCILHTKICIRPTVCLCTRIPTLCHIGCTYHFTCRWGCTVRPTCFHCSQFNPTYPCQIHCSIPISDIVACKHATLPFEVCPGGSIHDFEGPLVIERVEDIKALREDLRAAIARLDEVEKTGIDPLPEGKDLEVLEARLKEALREIAAQKGGGRSKAKTKTTKKRR